jgi:hypothetical protein
MKFFVTSLDSLGGLAFNLEEFHYSNVGLK